jgi:hypothetical protein
MVAFFDRQLAHDLAFAVSDHGAHPIWPEPDRLANLELVVRLGASEGTRSDSKELRDETAQAF